MRQTDRAFGFTFAALLVVISLVGWFVFDRVLYWAFGLSAITLLVAMTVPWVLLPLNLLWAQLHRVLRYVLNHLLLGLFYYLVLCPVGLVMKLLRFDPMQRRHRHSGESYWAEVDRHADANTLHDMF